MPHSFSKKKKKIKISKNHASISKLGAFSHASSILKKRKRNLFFSLNIKVFKIMHLFSKLGAFGYTLSPFSEANKVSHPFSKKKKKKRDPFQKQKVIMHKFLD